MTLKDQLPPRIEATFSFNGRKKACTLQYVVGRNIPSYDVIIDGLVRAYLKYHNRDGWIFRTPKDLYFKDIADELGKQLEDAFHKQ